MDWFAKRAARGLLLATAMLLPAGLPAAADDLRIAMKGAVDGADPHQSYTPNRNVQLHVYETLLVQDAHLFTHAQLAESWRAIDPNSWEFTLRQGVKFSDGSPLTPADAAFSIMRAKATTGIRTYSSNVRNVTSVDVTGDRTFVVHTSQPTPLQPDLMASIAIVNAKDAKDAAVADWNGGRAAVGTGPYRWIRWTPGQDVVLERNDGYWGPKEPWDKVTFRFIQDDSTRVAALLSGDVDVADTLPAELYDRIRNSDKVKLISTDSIFTDYFHLDATSATTPDVTGPDGKPWDKNPLRDQRVREAIDHALNRTALAERVMQGGASPAGQIAAAGFSGHVDGLEPAKFDPALSKKLLAEAGYPQGFTLRISCTNDRFAGDVQTCQAVGHMLDAVGIHVRINALPSAVYFRQEATMQPNGSPQFAADMAMFGSTTGFAIEGMNTIIHSPTTGLGPQNRNYYLDPKLDALLDKASAIFDATQRDQATAEATRYAMAQRAVLPLFFVKASWGLRRDLTLEPRGDQYTMATVVRKAK